MKNQNFYLCLLVLLLSFTVQTDADAQGDCSILGPASCTDSITVILPVIDGVITVDDDFIADSLGSAGADTHVKLIIPLPLDGKPYKAASFTNLNFCRTTIRVANAGEVAFAGYNINTPGDLARQTIEIRNCHNLELDGHGIQVLDAYGTGIPGRGENKSAVYIGKASSCINIHHLDIQNPSGFAGIMAKDSPECVNGTPIDIADFSAPFMHHIYIHHNHIHNVPQGEGIYAGDTAFMTGRVRGSCGKLLPQKIEHVWIYDNFIEETGWDAIQLGSCITGGRIFDNFCLEYGMLSEGGASEWYTDRLGQHRDSLRAKLYPAKCGAE